MVTAVFEAVRKSVQSMGIRQPQWLSQGKEPEYNIVEMGQGRDLLLLHGLLGAVSNWESVQPLIAEYCKPLAFEFPIMTAPRSMISVKALAAYTEFYVRKNALAPLNICGNSLGGHVALRMALAAPELIGCLVLSGTSGLYEHSVDSLPLRPGAAYVRSHMKRVFWNEAFITEEAVEGVVELLSVKSHILNIIESARSAKKDNLLEYLPLIQAPTLLIWGENDEVTTMDVAEQFHKHLPNSRLVTIKNCGHAPMIEYPAWFAEQVRSFLAEHQ